MRYTVLRFVFVLSIAFYLTDTPPQTKEAFSANNFNKQQPFATVENISSKVEKTIVAQPQKVKAEPIKVEQKASSPLPVEDVPINVFCGSPKQQTMKKPIRENVVLGKRLAEQRGWTDGEWTALLELYSCESSWSQDAGNPESGACGIPQSWPCSKLSNSVTDWKQNVEGQINWGYDYIARAYTTPSAALAHHYQFNWY